MDNFFDSFIEAYNQKCHIHYLVEGRILVICFDTEEGKLFLKLNHSTASVTNGYAQVEQQENVTISGNYEVLVALLSGKIMLREGILNQHLTISSTLRTTLLLEAILYLTNRKNPSVSVGKT